MGGSRLRGMKMEKIKVLNLYAGIGGNRKLWPSDKIEVTAVEYKQEIADILTRMQYDPSLPPRKRDPALQPLIEISKGLLAPAEGTVLITPNLLCVFTP